MDSMMEQSMANWMGRRKVLVRDFLMVSQKDLLMDTMMELPMANRMRLKMVLGTDFL